MLKYGCKNTCSYVYKLHGQCTCKCTLVYLLHTLYKIVIMLKKILNEFVVWLFSLISGRDEWMGFKWIDITIYV